MNSLSIITTREANCLYLPSVKNQILLIIISHNKYIVVSKTPPRNDFVNNRYYAWGMCRPSPEYGTAGLLLKITIC